VPDWDSLLRTPAPIPEQPRVRALATGSYVQPAAREKPPFARQTVAPAVTRRWQSAHALISERKPSMTLQQEAASRRDGQTPPGAATTADGFDSVSSRYGVPRSI
jgi:hypothetical protein